MRSHATPAASGTRRPPRHRLGEMVALFARGTTLRPCLPVAAVVGCVLSAINEGARIASGHTGWPTWVQVGLNSWCLSLSPAMAISPPPSLRRLIGSAQRARRRDLRVHGTPVPRS